jgi:hypothetical protein
LDSEAFTESSIVVAILLAAEVSSRSSSMIIVFLRLDGEVNPAVAPKHAFILRKMWHLQYD